MQKHKYDLTCPGALFMEIALGRLEHEKKCVDISGPGHTEMQYVTAYPTGCKTQVRCNVTRWPFYETHNGPR
jgi:hypothetical protein